MEPKRIEELDDERRLRLLIDNVIDYAIYTISLDGAVVTWNSGASRLKGYKSAEIIGRPYSTFFTPEDRARGLPERALSRAAEAGRLETEGWRIRKDGSRFWALAVIDAIRDEAGDLIGFAKITRDMTEHEEARARLLESEARFRRLIEAVVDYAIFQLDATGHVVTWNSGAERIKGYTAQEIIGKHFSVFYTEEDRAADLPALALERAARNGKFEAEGWRIRKDGSKFQGFVVIDPIRNEVGDVVGYAKVTRDITDRWEAQCLLKEMQEQLAVSQKMEAIGQLSGGIAHDFNNLLMIVQGNLETARRAVRKLEPHDPGLDRTIANAMRGAQRAAALTSRLLAFSRRQALDPRPLDVNKFLAGAADFLQRTLGERIEIEMFGAPGLWKIEADPNHLETALVNLAVNARDAMPEGGKLTLEATNIFADAHYCRTNPELSPGQYVLICVSDSGTGMPADVLSRAFEPFFTTKDIGQGTGLGLSQVYGFVKQSGGHVKIYSEINQGTTVKIFLPRYDRSAEEPIELEHDSSPKAELGESLLVVEDDHDVRTYLTDVLRGLGYHVIPAPDAQAALGILEQEARSVDLLLTDVIMPGMNGRELGQRAQALRSGLRVLYMTGYARNSVIHHGRLDEGVELLQKPISQVQLAERIRDVLDRGQHRG